MKIFDNFSQKISYAIELTRGIFFTAYYGLFYRKAKIGKKFRIGRYCNFVLWDNYQLTIGESVYMRNFCRIQIENGILKIGNGTFFNNFCTINCLSKITIGNNCLFGEGVKIYDHNHNYRDNKKLISEQGYNLGEIKIGNNCWIGSNVVILKGVKIGNNVVVGANVTVFKDLPDGSIVKSCPPEVSPCNTGLNHE